MIQKKSQKKRLHLHHLHLAPKIPHLNKPSAAIVFGENPISLAPHVAILDSHAISIGSVEKGKYSSQFTFISLTPFQSQDL